MTWADLFERAEDHATTVADVRAALTARRDRTDGDDTADDGEGTA